MDVTEFTGVFAAIVARGAFGQAGASTSQFVMLAAAIAGLTILMISTYRRVRNAQRPERSIVRERYAKLQREAEGKRNVEQVMLELDQLARQIHGRLDTRFAKLEMIIRDADERIDRLSRLLRAVDGGEGVDVTLDREDPHDPPESDSHTGPQATIHRLADSGLSPVEIAQEVDRTVGEVELILALRRTKEAAASPPRVINSPQPASSS